MATQTSRLKLRKPATTENWNVATDFNDNMDKLEAEAVARNRSYVWSDTSLTLSDFISQCEAAMSDVGVYYLGYINLGVAQNFGINVNGYVVGLNYNGNYKKIEIHGSSSVTSVMGKRAVIVKAGGTWASSFMEVPNNTDIKNITDRFPSPFSIERQAANSSTFVFDAQRISSGVYSMFLLVAGNGASKPSLYHGFIQTESNGNGVTLTLVGGVAISGIAATWANNKLTVTTSATQYGGFRLIWLS